MTNALRPIAEQDPREVLDWGVFWLDMLQTGESVQTVTWSASPSGIGLVIQPLDTIDGTSWARLEIDPLEHAHDRWRWPGQVVELVCEVRTSDQREFVRTIPIRVFRGAHSPRERVLVA